MGSLGGHVVPGVFFVIYGIAWLILSYWLHFTLPTKPSSNSTNGHSDNKSSNKAGSRNQRSLSNPSYSDYKREIELTRKSYIPIPICRSVPLEPIIKGILSFLGILVEAFFDVVDGKLVFSVVHFHDNETGRFGGMSKLQHITMYTMFLVSAIVDLSASFIRLPRATTKIFFAVAFSIEALLFWFHAATENKSELEYKMHLLLILSILSCTLFSSLRMLSPANLLINSGLSFGMLLQGFWFVAVGVVLYGQSVPWDVHDHYNVMFVVAMFAWIILIIMFVMVIVYIAMMSCFKASIKYKFKPPRSSGINMLPFTNPIADSPERKRLMENVEDEEENDNLIKPIIEETAT